MSQAGVDRLVGARGVSFGFSNLDACEFSFLVSQFVRCGGAEKFVFLVGVAVCQLKDYTRDSRSFAETAEGNCATA